jgi:NADH-quinone oxidoreductase subunit G
MAEFEIEINGKKCVANPGEMIIQVADREGEHIPRFCYHKKLSIVANCRMCLVEVEKAPKTLPACATPVMENMKVFTKSEAAIESQKAIMEFLLVNHPLDCPICDQGGECELQDVSVGYGVGFSRYDQSKRSVDDEDLGPLVSTDMTRCIHCTRCVRFGEEVAGVRELGAIFRGEHMKIGTYVKQVMQYEMSGNVIDLCPVGALTSKPFRFRARAWELTQHASVAPHDCVGSNIYLHTRGKEVMRVVPRENECVNGTWISDRDRFSYEGLQSSDRLTTPMMKRGDKWEVVDWHQALEHVAACLQAQVDSHGPEQLGGLISSNTTVESCYLFQKLLRALGTENIDHRLRQVDVKDQSTWPTYLGAPGTVKALEEKEVVLLIGSSIRQEQPIIAQKFRAAAENGAKISCISCVDHPLNFSLSAKHIVGPASLLSALAGLVKAIITSTGAGDQSLKTLVDSVEIVPTLQQMADDLLQEDKKDNKMIVLGALALNHPDAAEIRAYATAIAELTGAKIAYLTLGANSVGASLAGALPHRTTAGESVTKPGLSAQEMFDTPLKTYCVVGFEPDKDCADGASAMKALKQAEFVVACTAFQSDSLLAVADVLLPITPFSETTGTFVNAFGEWQTSRAALKPKGNARSAWKVLRAIAGFCQFNNFEYLSSEEVVQAVYQKNKQHPPVSGTVPAPSTLRSALSGKLVRVAEVPLYAGDPLVRRAKSLQKMAQFLKHSRLRLHPHTAKEYGLSDQESVMVKQGGGAAAMTVLYDEAVPKGVALIPAGVSVSSQLGALFGQIEIEKRS